MPAKAGIHDKHDSGFPLSRERRSALAVRCSLLASRRRSSSDSQRAPVADKVSNERLLQRGHGGEAGIEMMRRVDGPLLSNVTKAALRGRSVIVCLRGQDRGCTFMMFMYVHCSRARDQKEGREE